MDPISDPHPDRHRARQFGPALECVLAFVVATHLTAAIGEAQESPGSFEIHRLAPGVHAAIVTLDRAAARAFERAIRQAKEQTGR